MSTSRSEENSDMAKSAEEIPADVSAAQEIQALEDAVRVTLSNTEADGLVTPEEIAALQGVARRHGRVPLILDPVAIELVEAIINVNYGHLQRPREVWQATATKVAKVLFDAPEAHARLENLWCRLVEST